MLLQVFTFVLITHHAFGPCCCAPIGYIGNSDEVRKGLDGMWTHSSSDFRKVPLGQLKRLFESKNGKGGKNEQEDIIQIPDDMFVTCEGCQPTKELCSSPYVTEKYSATTIQYSETKPTTCSKCGKYKRSTTRRKPEKFTCDGRHTMGERPSPTTRKCSDHVRSTTCKKPPKQSPCDGGRTMRQRPPLITSIRVKPMPRWWLTIKLGTTKQKCITVPGLNGRTRKFDRTTIKSASP